MFLPDVSYLCCLAGATGGIYWFVEIIFNPPAPEFFRGNLNYFVPLKWKRKKEKVKVISFWFDGLLIQSKVMCFILLPIFSARPRRLWWVKYTVNARANLWEMPPLQLQFQLQLQLRLPRKKQNKKQRSCFNSPSLCVSLSVPWQNILFKDKICLCLFVYEERMSVHALFCACTIQTSARSRPAPSDKQVWYTLWLSDWGPPGKAGWSGGGSLHSWPLHEKRVQPWE